jgi:hypothetical protein
MLLLWIWESQVRELIETESRRMQRFIRTLLKGIEWWASSAKEHSAPG